MELISRNDIDGSFEMEDTLRAIGVSTKNLLPNSEGIVPLSNQNAMIIEEPLESLETDVLEEEPANTLESLDFGSEEEAETQGSEEQALENVPEEDIEISLPPSEPVETKDPEVIPAGLFIDSEPNTEEVAEESYQEEESKPVEEDFSSNNEAETDAVVEEEIPSMAEEKTVSVSSKANNAFEKLINDLIENYENKQRSDLNKLKNTILQAYKDLNNNLNVSHGDVKKNTDEMLASIPSLSDGYNELSNPDDALTAPELSEIPSIDSEEIKPKFVI